MNTSFGLMSKKLSEVTLNWFHNAKKILNRIWDERKCVLRICSSTPAHHIVDRLVIHNTLIILIIFHFSACDIFTTRTPEKPNQGGSTFQPPTSADIVLLNLKNAISERNTENYVRCFVDSLSSSRRFEFIPASNSLARYPLLFSRWTLQSERSYFDNLKAVMQQSAPSSLSLTGSFKVITSDSATYNADYQLTFQHGISGIPETVRGNLQFYLATDRNKIWSIYQWIDINIGQEAGWSELKGRFGN